MHEVRSLFAPDRYTAKRMAKPVNFVCIAPEAREVYLIGDFNNWEPDNHRMERQPDGTWLIQVSPHHGHHQYLFLVDGKAALDPRAHGTTRNLQGERVSLRAVS